MNDRKELDQAWIKIISQAIIRQRAILDITQDELARRVNCDEKHLGRIERGEKMPSSALLALIQIELQINANELLNTFKEMVNTYKRSQMDEQ